MVEIFAKSPRLTLVLVIDQFANHELQKLLPHFTGGLKFLYENSIRYENAFHPHGMPETGVGHATIGSGTLAKDHGIIGNFWFDTHDKQIICDADTPENAAVFAPQGFYEYGASPRNIMVDTLADQLILNSYKGQENTVLSLALKSRAAIGMAGRLGKAFWLDAQTGFFTSSKAYYEQLPAWVNRFNTESKMSELTTYTWRLKHPENSKAYDFPLINHYENTAAKESIINKELVIDRSQKNAFEFFEKTPQANQLLLDFAWRCIQENMPDNNKHLVVWLSMSSLDLAGHPFGPQSREVIDILYHIDEQLGVFLKQVFGSIKAEDVFIALTADHGVFPILENVREQGLNFARRIPAESLLEKINDHVESLFGVKNLVTHFVMPAFYCNNQLLKQFEKVKQKEILYTIKQLLLEHPGIINAWTYHELERSTFHLNDLRQNYKNQQYRGRTGHIICQVQPYNYIDSFTSGTSHGTPYDYDTHVPLMLYQHKKTKPHAILQRVYIPQLTVTLARLLNVPRPSASSFDILPGIAFNKVKQERAHA